ncbi:MAG: serine/threonine-protein kinase [Pseudonocardia sp.]
MGETTSETTSLGGHVQHGNGPDDPDATRYLGPPAAGPGPAGAAGGAGRVLGGRYRLEALLGRGGMAEVHRATDLRLDRPVAVKLFRQGTDRDSARRFTEEAHTLANLGHPGLVAVYDSGVEGQQPYLVMELVSGWPLSEVTAQEQLPLDEIVRIGVALGEVLGYVHQQGIVHRDVKPSNVLIGRDNRIRLADFGTARPARSGEPGFGTPAYLAPEQVRGEFVGPPADVYALGLVLLEAVTGRVEYPGTASESAGARLHRSPAVPAELPDNLRGALLSMTDPDPGVRPTAAQAVRMLREEPERMPVAAAAVEQPAGNTTRQILFIALGALILAALIGFVAFATSDEDATTTAQPSRSATATQAPATTRRTTPTRATQAEETDEPTRPALPTSGISLPEMPDISLPDARELPTSVVDDVKKAWERFTTFLAGLF